MIGAFFSRQPRPSPFFNLHLSPSKTRCLTGYPPTPPYNSLSAPSPHLFKHSPVWNSSFSQFQVGGPLLHFRQAFPCPENFVLLFWVYTLFFNPFPCLALYYLSCWSLVKTPLRPVFCGSNVLLSSASSTTLLLLGPLNLLIGIQIQGIQIRLIAIPFTWISWQQMLFFHQDSHLLWKLILLLVLNSGRVGGGVISAIPALLCFREFLKLF